MKRLNSVSFSFVSTVMGCLLIQFGVLSMNSLLIACEPGVPTLPAGLSVYAPAPCLESDHSYFLFPFLASSASNANNAAESTIEKQHIIWKIKPEKIVIDAPLSYIYHQDTSSDVTIIRIFIRGGQKAEPENKKGLAYLTTRLAVEVTEPAQIRKLITLGSSSSTWCEGDFSVISVTCLSEYLDSTLKIIMNTVNDPLFTNLRIPNVKRSMEHRQKEEEDTPEQLLERETRNIFYGGSGYSGSIFGDSSSLDSIKTKDIESFYKTHFTKSNIVIVVSSDLSKEEVSKVIQKYFQTLPQGESSREESKSVAFPRVNPVQKAFFFKKDTVQSVISLSAGLPETTPQNYVYAQMLEVLLGDGIGSKLWPLREEENLAYHLSANVTHKQEGGVLVIMVKTANQSCDTALISLQKIIAGIGSVGITADELEIVKIRTGTRFLRENETKEKRTYHLGFFAVNPFGTGGEFMEAFFSQLESVTLEGFNRYIQEVLNPERLVSIVIGPKQPQQQPKQH